MDKLLMIIIKAMNTVDGNRNSLKHISKNLLDTKKKYEDLLSYKDYDDDR